MNLEPLINRVASFVSRHQLLKEGDAILVAVSAGSDSMALLHLLHAFELRLKLTVAYIDHGLRPTESPEEKRLIAKYCTALGIPFVTAVVDVAALQAKENRSPEEAARLLRYQALEDLRIRHEASFIALGHTADDQVEEFFLRLLRGSGHKGFCGMAPRRGSLIRPLLEERKSTLLAYLEGNRLNWCLDSSNQQRAYLRNRVRLDLLPLLEADYSPGIRATVLRAMAIFGEEEQLLENLTDDTWKACLLEHQQGGASPPRLVLEINACRRQHAALLRRIMERCFWMLGAKPSFSQISTIIDFLDHGQNGGILHFDGGLRAMRRGGELHFSLAEMPPKGRILATTKPVIAQPIAGSGSYPLPAIDRELRLTMQPMDEHISGQLCLDAANITFPLLLRSVKPGERFTPEGGVGSKKVNRFLNERKIAAAERFAWPVLVMGSDILALPGLEISHNYRVSEATKIAIIIEWRRLSSPAENEIEVPEISES
jgi:tRNA(Ile)-lysidine synthase